MSDSTTCEPPLRAAEPRGALALIVPLRGDDRAPIELAPGEVLSVGRSSSSGIVVDDGSVSRLHATLCWDGGDRLRVTDHASRNGTLVGGERVQGSRELESGAIVSVGPQSLLVLLPSSAPATATPETSSAMERVREVARRAAASELPVLIVGETGVGKEVLARLIHQGSPRRGGPFVAQNCGSITESLAESILFGHERGAFTGAQTRSIGVFEAASGGTLFLDEIGELAPSSQARLLRVLEQREVVRIGSTRPTRIDTRLLAATHRDLDAMVKAGSFRSDLLYRIDVIRIVIPPLRERPEDIDALADEILREADPSGAVRLSSEARAALSAHDWPGNVRELRNALQRAVALRSGASLTTADFPGLVSGTAGPSGPLRSAVSDVERNAIVAALEATGGNRTRAAAKLGIARRTLLYKLERLGIEFPSRG